MQTVHDGDGTHLACRIEHTLERRDAFGTVALEHGELEFDGRSPTVGGLEHTHGV